MHLLWHLLWADIWGDVELGESIEQASCAMLLLYPVYNTHVLPYIPIAFSDSHGYGFDNDLSEPMNCCIDVLLAYISLKFAGNPAKSVR